MRKACLILLAVIFLALAVPVHALSKTDYLKFVGSEVSVTQAYSEYQICNPTAINFTTSAKNINNFDWNFNEVKGKVKSSWFEIRLNETYKENVYTPNLVCSPSLDPYFDTNCTDKGGTYKDVERWRWRWIKFDPTKYTYPIQTCFNIRIYGTYNPAVDDGIAIDNILNFAGYSFEEYAWWNASFSKCRNITISNPVANHPSYIHVTYDSDMNADFSDIRFVNRSCGDDGYKLSYMKRLCTNSVTCDFDVLLDGTQTGISMYYGSGSSTSESSPSAVWGPNLVAYYIKDEGTATTVNDYSGNSLTGTMNATWNTTHAHYLNSITYSLGKDTEASDNNLLDITSAITIEAWVQPKAWSAGGYGAIVGKRGATNNYQFYYRSNTGYLGFYGATPDDSTSNGISLDAMTFVAVSLTSGGTLSFFKNGSNFQNLTGKSFGAANAFNYKMGCSASCTDASDQVYGVIDEVRVFNTSLSVNTINAHYQATEPTFSIGAEQSGSSNTAPKWSANLSSIVSTFSPTTTSNFQITWTDDNDTNGYNYSVLSINHSGTFVNFTTTRSGNTSYANVTLPAYTGGMWKWYANDSQNAWNTTDTWGYTINKASTPIQTCYVNVTGSYCIDTQHPSGYYIYNGSLGYFYTTYPYMITTQSGVIGLSSGYGETQLYRNMVNTTATYFLNNLTNNTAYSYARATNTDPIQRYEINYSVSTNQNYTMNNSYNFVWINQATPNVNITFNTSDAVSDGTPVRITCNYPAEISIGLYNNTSSLSNPYDFDTTGKGGTSVTFICNTTGNWNYTSASTNKTLTITTGSGLLVYVYDEESSAPLTFNITVNNGTVSNTAYGQTNPYTNNSILGSLTIDITSSGYQQRSYYATTSATNTTNLTAYLMATGSGTWVTFYVYTPTEMPIENALINVERLIPPASWLTVAQKKTDASGVGSIFLSPVTTYRFNFSASGYTNQSLQLQPSASPYVIYMIASSVLNISYNTSYKNLALWIEPNGTALYWNSTYGFRYYIYSSDNQLEYWGWRIVYYNGTVILLQNSTNAGGGTYTQSISTTTYGSNYITLNYWFKKAGFSLVNASRRYYIYGVNYTNTSIMAEIADIAAGVAAGTPDVTMEQFAFISMIASIICMAAASSQLKMFGSGIIGLMILSMFTFIGTYIWGAAYIVGWEMVGLFALGVVAAIYIRGGFG